MITNKELYYITEQEIEENKSESIKTQGPRMPRQ